MTLQPSLPITDNIPTYRMTAVQALAKLRQEWEEIAQGESLLDVSASVGLMLADIKTQHRQRQPESQAFRRSHAPGRQRTFGSALHVLIQVAVDVLVQG